MDGDVREKMGANTERSKEKEFRSEKGDDIDQQYIN